MKIILIPQGSNPKVDVLFTGSNDVLTITIDGKTDTFDFSQMPDGKSTEIESTLPRCPVKSAERKNGELTVTMYDWRTESERNMENEVIEL